MHQAQLGRHLCQGVIADVQLCQRCEPCQLLRNLQVVFLSAFYLLLSRSGSPCWGSCAIPSSLTQLMPQEHRSHALWGACRCRGQIEGLFLWMLQQFAMVDPCILHLKGVVEAGFRSITSAIALEERSSFCR